MSEPDLKPCPFCGRGSELLVEAYQPVQSAAPRCAWVKCLSCGAEGPLEDTREQAIERWNARAAVPA